MTKDLNKEIFNIDYNHLNLPTKVEFEADPNSPTGKFIEYTYDATGIKLEKVVQQENQTNQSFTQYDGSFIYEHSGTANPELKFFPHPEGYIEPNGSNFDYVYQYKDHLGNVRLSYKDNNGTLEIIEEKNYYPFGLKHKGYNNVINGTDHKYGFGGKEENDELGLEWLDFGWRNYDPTIERWMNLDPLADDSDNYEFSPYNYAINNPIFFIDPDGMKWAENSGIEGVKSEISSERLALTTNMISLVLQFVDSKDDAQREELASQINTNNNRVQELDKTSEEIELLGDDQRYTYSLTTGNPDVSMVKSFDEENVLIEGSSTGLHIHEITHIAIERSKGRELEFNDEGKMKPSSQYMKFFHEAHAYLSQWGYEGKSNDFITTNGSISNKTNWHKYKINNSLVPQHSMRFVVDKLNRNKIKNPFLFTIYHARLKSKWGSLEIANEIITDPRLSR
jgi:RHS repeat-associated protein